MIRQIPPQMWDDLSRADAAASEIIGRELHNLRAAVKAIGNKYGFTVDELVTLGVLTPERKPATHGLKGSRRN